MKIWRVSHFPSFVFSILEIIWRNARGEWKKNGDKLLESVLFMVIGKAQIFRAAEIEFWVENLIKIMAKKVPKTMQAGGYWFRYWRNHLYPRQEIERTWAAFKFIAPCLMFNILHRPHECGRKKKICVKWKIIPWEMLIPCSGLLLVEKRSRYMETGANL